MVIRITTISVRYGDKTVDDIGSDITCKPAEIPDKIHDWLVQYAEEKPRDRIDVTGFSVEVKEQVW